MHDLSVCAEVVPEYWIYPDSGYPRAYTPCQGDCSAVDWRAAGWHDTPPEPIPGMLNCAGGPYRLHLNHALRIGDLHARDIVRVYTDPLFYSR